MNTVCLIGMLVVTAMAIYYLWREITSPECLRSRIAGTMGMWILSMIAMLDYERTMPIYVILVIPYMLFSRSKMWKRFWDKPKSK